MTGMDHIGRSWPGRTHLEDGCPCEKAACGLAVSGSAPDCPEHGINSGKTLRQMHGAEECPNRNDGIVWADMADGIHQKGMRMTAKDGLVTIEGYVRDKPGIFSIYDPQAITLRGFGHDD